MKSLRFAVQVIAFLVIIVLLAGLSINLIGTWPLETTTLSNVTPVVASPTAEPQKPPSIERAATSTSTPRVYFATPIPGPTYTPTPILEPTEEPPLFILDNKRLPLESINNLYPPSPQENEFPEFTVLGWTSNNEIVIQRKYYTYTDNYKVLSRIEGGYWRIPPDSEVAQPLMNWAGELLLTMEQKQFIERSDLGQATDAPAGIEMSSSWYPSPNGDYIIYAKQRDQLQVYSVNDNILLTTLPITQPGDKTKFHLTGPVWSPDGTQIAYEIANSISNDKWDRSYQIYINDIDGHNLTAIKISGYPYSHIKDIAWSPDGRYIAFITQSADHMPTDIFVATSDGSAIHNLTRNGGFVEPPLFWSPDGRSILYSLIDINSPSLSGFWTLTLDEK